MVLGFPQRLLGFDPRTYHVGITADEVALRAGFPEKSHSLLAPLSSRDGTMDPLVAWAPSGLSRAPLEAIKEKVNTGKNCASRRKREENRFMDYGFYENGVKTST
jgi:hypothetical protein